MLIFTMIATRKVYTQHEAIVSEAVTFQPFDLRALTNSCNAGDNSPRRPSHRKKWVSAQAAS